jgi:putative membrane protein
LSSSSASTAGMNNRMPGLVKDLFMGVCLGAANIIPGVSGGTFLLIFKIYERVFDSVNRINKTCLYRALGVSFRFVKQLGQKGTYREMAGFLEQNDFLFLLRLLLGAVIAILGLSTVMKHLLTHYFSLTYSLFFGLILVSILVPVKMINCFRPYLIWLICLGAAMTMMVSFQVNPYDKVKQKSAHYEIQYENQIGGQEGLTDGQTQKATVLAPVADYLYAGLCGAVSICAMVLPGISGSLVLILMGAYFDVLSAISGLTHFQVDAMVFLGCFGVGILLGGLLFARLVNYVFKRYYDATMAVLLGLMAGSLWPLWPFKQVVVMEEQYVKQNGVITMLENVRVYTNINMLPPVDSQLLWSCLLFVLGCVVMYGFLRIQESAASS